jgi:hypothetical protein
VASEQNIAPKVHQSIENPEPVPLQIEEEGHSYKSYPNTITVPCHYTRLGDVLILQGRPCQVIRISTSTVTGQHRFLGVDLFTKMLHEESSFITNPTPGVNVQTMLGPVFEQYRVLDVEDGTGKRRATLLLPTYVLFRQCPIVPISS